MGVVAVAVGVVLLFPSVFDLDEETSTETFQEVTNLVFDLESSSVSFIGGSADTVVEVSVTTGLLDGDVTVEQTDGTLRLNQTCPLILGWGCRAFFSVMLPAGVGVSGSTSNGFITAESLDEPISLTTSNGAINVVELAGSAVFMTSNGDVLASGLTSQEVEASTSNGRVQLEFAAAPGSVEATSSNGAIEVILPPDAPAYAVETSTSNGRVETDIRTDPSSSDSIVAETSNGSITIRYGD